MFVVSIRRQHFQLAIWRSTTRHKFACLLTAINCCALALAVSLTAIADSSFGSPYESTIPGPPLYGGTRMREPLSLALHFLTLDLLDLAGSASLPGGTLGMGWNQHDHVSPPGPDLQRQRELSLIARNQNAVSCDLAGSLSLPGSSHTAVFSSSPGASSVWFPRDTHLSLPLPGTLSARDRATHSHLSSQNSLVFSMTCCKRATSACPCTMETRSVMRCRVPSCVSVSLAHLL